jgi:hypothetical protein
VIGNAFQRHVTGRAEQRGLFQRDVGIGDFPIIVAGVAAADPARNVSGYGQRFAIVDRYRKARLMFRL